MIFYVLKHVCVRFNYTLCLENENAVLTTLNSNFVPNSHFEKIISQRRRLNASQDVQGRLQSRRKRHGV